MKKLLDFFAGVRQEVSLVNWLDIKSVFQLTFLILLFVFIFGLFFFALDYLMINIVNLLNYL